MRKGLALIGSNSRRTNSRDLGYVLDCNLIVSLCCIVMLIMLTYDCRCYKMAFIL